MTQKRFHYIIDGYNLIHAIPSLKKLVSANQLIQAREQLLFLLEKFTLKNKIQCTVIFDGTKPSNEKTSSTVHITYSFPSNADNFIKKLIEKSSSRSWLMIVSSDREILNFASVCSCSTFTSKEFAKKLTSPNINQKREEKTDTENLSRKEVEEWLRIFGEKS